MKINPSPWSSPINTGAEPRPAGGAAPPSVPATKVSLSGPALWIADVREAALSSPEIRADVVAYTRAALAAGNYEQTVDLDVVVDRLLAGG